MEFRDYLGVLRKYWASIVVFTLLGVAAASAYIYLASPVYTSSATVYLSVNGGSSSTDLIQSTNYASAQARSFAQMVTMPQVLDPVIADL
ncbi:MAG: hypothetical protein LBV00_09020, partial [Propionibacteriaceae bacterium]|nr:hypothetical protein [Propionibacteriaceae bacterium]